jgi:hypothetical protein
VFDPVSGAVASVGEGFFVVFRSELKSFWEFGSIKGVREAADRLVSFPSSAIWVGGDILGWKTAFELAEVGSSTSGEVGVLGSDGCPFGGLKGHKTKNSVRCLYSTEPTSKYYSSDNREARVFISGKGEFCADMKIVCGSYVDRRWGSNIQV